MQTFLEKTATYLLNSFPEGLGDVCVVLPNRRASLFLKRDLSRMIDKPIWSPEVLSIEDFVFKLAGFQRIEQVYLLFELYEIYTQTEKNGATGFDEFLGWGNVILNDFNDLDLYLADPQLVFNYLNDVKAMTLWNPEGKSLTPFQLNYLRFFNSLAELYAVLSERLVNSGRVYQGLAYRKLAEFIDAGSVTLPWEKIVFAGFNALTPAEEKIITHFESTGKATVLWDADRYYIDDPMQEAGTFLRKVYQKKQEDFKWITNDLKEDTKDIHLIGVPLMVGQVKAAGDILRKLVAAGKNINSTAVILNDESLLFPLLNSLPDEIKEFNVTMGLPLKSTALYKLIDSLLTLQENEQKFAATRHHGKNLYYTDVLKILEHPYLRDLIMESAENDPVQMIRSSNKAFFSPDEVAAIDFGGNKALEEIITLIFSPLHDNVAEMVAMMKKLLAVLKEHFQAKAANENAGNHKLELENVFHFALVFNKLDEMIRATGFIEGLKTFRFVFKEIVQSVTLPFYGEPLRGIQVMGMLESRTLDFENVIMLSVNEDLIPSGGSTNSFIPFEVRKTFSLPVVHDRNAVYAYHFYRLLQRSKNVYLLYNTEAGQLGGREKSRFISQMQYELRQYNQKINITEDILSVNIPESKPEPAIDIPKTPDILLRLEQLAATGFSASSLNVYRNCSLQFYFRYVMGIDEVEEVEETIEAATLGKVIHSVLQNLYTPVGNKILTAGEITLMRKQLPALIKNAFTENYPDGEIRFGKNLLIVKVAESYLNGFLDSELKLLAQLEKENKDLQVGEMEKRISTGFTSQSGKEIFLKGFIDRIDRVGDTLRIIDYKTGKVEQRELLLANWETLLESHEFAKGFQLMFYNYLYKREFPEERALIASGIISFRNLKAGFLPVGFPEEPGTEWISSFEGVLQKLFSEIYNPEISFSKTEDTDRCVYCPFKTVCGR